MSAPALARDALADARERARDALAPLAAACAAEGMPPLALDGQLIRPVLAFAAAEALGIGGGEPLACAALAVQLAHEASLVHDDIVDGAGVRRGRQTAAAASGVGPALVLGDHLLAWGYRLAARTGSLAFVQAYADAVERTIAGEVEQGRAAGRRLDAEACERISRAKAGALLGCAAAAGPLLAGHADAYAVRDLGVRLGLVYQMLDDLLD
ncbi:MAG TPA: polyprenyl synthetase family protein, partial [Longimicrobium sp.]|nr:polyprenyl synthetase family protein [Longimicrobium sp.]